MQIELDWLFTSAGRPSLTRLSYYDDARESMVRGFVVKAWKFYLRLCWKTN